MGKSEKPAVMLVGVLPPPFHGQSIATKALFDAEYPGMRVVRIGIHSSKTIFDVGRPSLGKAFALFGTIAQIWSAWIRDRPTALYYTAGSGAWVPFVRDILLLALCRPLFRKTIIHYHSGDLAGFLEASRLRKWLGRFVYGRGAWSIKLGQGCPIPDFPRNRQWIVPNGVKAPCPMPPRSESDRFRILFLGNLFEDKGVFDLIDAVSLVARRSSLQIDLRFVGAWPDERSRATGEQKLEELPKNVACHTPQPAYGEEKWEYLRASDVLVFPTRYRRENAPLVIIEAMAAGLPVIATPWRGIPALVADQETGVLVPISDLNALAEAIESLAHDETLRSQMGVAARETYECLFTEEIFIERMRAAFEQAIRTDSHTPVSSHS